MRLQVFNLVTNIIFYRENQIRLQIINSVIHIGKFWNLTTDPRLHIQITFNLLEAYI